VAYQSLNIIGSFTTGVGTIQRSIDIDRDRAAAYRSALREQMEGENQASAEEVAAVGAQEQSRVDDVPHNRRRNPYLFVQVRPAKESAAAENGGPQQDEDKLDVVV
jgi:hypothetical protein